MVQAQIFWKHNPDGHYCTSIYNFIKQKVLKQRANSTFFTADAKIRILAGEIGFPLACVAPGQKIVVELNESFQVADHNFSKISIIPDAEFIQQISGENDSAGDEFNIDTNGSLVRFIMALKMVVRPFAGSPGWVKLSKLL